MSSLRISSTPPPLPPQQRRRRGRPLASLGSAVLVGGCSGTLLAGGGGSTAAPPPQGFDGLAPTTTTEQLNVEVSVLRRVSEAASGIAKWGPDSPSPPYYNYMSHRRAAAASANRSSSSAACAADKLDAVASPTTKPTTTTTTRLSVVRSVARSIARFGPDSPSPPYYNCLSKRYRGDHVPLLRRPQPLGPEETKTLGEEFYHSISSDALTKNEITAIGNLFRSAATNTGACCAVHWDAKVEIWHQLRNAAYTQYKTDAADRPLKYAGIGFPEDLDLAKLETDCAQYLEENEKTISNPLARAVRAVQAIAADRKDHECPGAFGGEHDESCIESS